MTARLVLPLPAREALARGNRIEAIKALREVRPMGLEEAKELVEAYERHPELFDDLVVEAPPREPEPDGSGLPRRALEALARGDKIGAIKEVRLGRRLGLKEAKDLVEAHLAGDPQLRQSFDHSLQSEPSGSAGWILALLAGVALGYVAVRLTL